MNIAMKAPIPTGRSMRAASPEFIPYAPNYKISMKYNDISNVCLPLKIKG